MTTVILFVSYPVFAQDDYEEIEMSPIEELAYETGTGEFRGFGQSSSAGEQLVDRKYLFEVGGKEKNFDQIKDIPYSYLTVDNTEVGQESHPTVDVWTIVIKN